MSSSTPSTIPLPHTQPISSRSPRTLPQKIYGLLSGAVFLFGCLMVNSFQFAFLLPLRFIPFKWANELYGEGIRYTKGSFATLLVLMSQWFSPTQIVLTFETEGMGKFTPEEIQTMVKRNERGEVESVELPDKSVLIANHQVYADWWYAWCLTYFTGTHKDVYIVLKKSLKWVPILGWGMQFFDFIFLARSWASDRLHLSAHLSSLGRQAQAENKPLTLILYPEGTLVSKDTRPISKKFADKLGISDMRNSLLPRSTGLHYSLRSLAPRIPSLHLIDVTVVYPGIPPMGYGQSYYTLRSIFMDGTPPPAIHMHLRSFHVATAVPIGDLSSSDPSSLPHGADHHDSKKTVEVDVPEVEREQFESWLRKLWTEKDESIDRFFNSNSFLKSGEKKAEGAAVTIPLRLRSQMEVFDAFCFFLPVALVGYFRSR